MKKRNKFSAKKTIVDSIRFDSQAESRRYLHLKQLQKEKQIKNLSLQPKFDLTSGGVKVCTYSADFIYEEVGSALPIVEDYKGQETPLFRLKRKMFLALYGDQFIFRQSKEMRNGDYEETDFST